MLVYHAVGTLPDFFVGVLETFASGLSQSLVQVEVHGETETVRRAQATFLQQWVEAIPPATLLSLVMLEAERLGAAQQKHAKKFQGVSGEVESTESSVDTQAAYMQIAMDLQSGAITSEEYSDLIAAQTLKVTFQYLVMEKSKKEEVLLSCAQTQKTHSLLKDDPVFRSLLPSLVLSASFSLPSSADVAEYIRMPLDYLENMSRYKNSFKPRDKIMLDTYMYCSNMLSGTPSEQQQIHEWVEDLANTCLSDDLSSEEVVAERTSLSHRISNLCNGKVDIQQILEDQIELWFAIPDENITGVLECGLTIALALIQQSENRSLLFSGLPGFVSKVSNPLSASASVSVSVSSCDVSVPLFVFEELENKFNKVLLRVFARLKSLKSQYVSSVHGSISVDGIVLNCPSPDEVLAAFDISSLLMWYPVCKHLGDGYRQAELSSHKGFYPSERLPAALCSYLLPRARVAFSVVQDPRLAQPLLSLMAKLGESVNDFELIKQATEASLALTEGKVTELTPTPIPEALANAYQQRGEFTLALQWYELALDGIKTCVLRQKTDDIILNACLVAAKCDNKEQALRWAFMYSPQFLTSSSTSKLGLVGAARPILVQQMHVWCQLLEYPSLRAAKLALLSAQ